MIFVRWGIDIIPPTIIFLTQSRLMSFCSVVKEDVKMFLQCERFLQKGRVTYLCFDESIEIVGYRRSKDQIRLCWLLWIKMTNRSPLVPQHLGLVVTLRCVTPSPEHKPVRDVTFTCDVTRDASFVQRPTWESCPLSVTSYTSMCDVISSRGWRHLRSIYRVCHLSPCPVILVSTGKKPRG